MKRIKLHKENFTLEDEVFGFMEKRVTKFGSGAKIDSSFASSFLGRSILSLFPKSLYASRHQIMGYTARDSGQPELSNLLKDRHRIQR